MSTQSKWRHAHNEAFKLMAYACRTCGHRETIWNSRDGVTPFGCACPSCGGTLDHVEWQRDVYAPDHVLRNGQRFWRDGTPDEAEAILRKRIDLCRDKYPVSPESEEEMVRLAREGGNDFSEFQKGWPMLSIAS